MKTCFSPELFEKHKNAGTSSFLFSMFQDDGHLKILANSAFFGINIIC